MKTTTTIKFHKAPGHEAFMHPLDRKALGQLRAIPLFPTASEAFIRGYSEHQVRMLSLAQKVRLGEHQLPRYYKALPTVCDALDIPLPEMFLEMTPMPNAYTQGNEKAFLTVTSGIIELLTPDELDAVIAHECGHIACKHVLYHTMADFMRQGGEMLWAPLKALSLPMQLALLRWHRYSELSADRAAALVLGGPDLVVRTMMKLAGGSTVVTEGINLELYLAQAQEFDEAIGASNWDGLLQGLALLDQDHPFLAVRAHEITKWCASPEFTQLMNPEIEACPVCHAPIEPGWQFCGKCGAKLA